jgi:hypothetical protein
MAKTPKPGQEIDPDPEAAARAKAERREREKEQLLRDVAAAATNDLRAQVGYVLSHYPAARDSDVRLAHLVWQVFYPDYVDGEWVKLRDMYELPRQTTITRTRAIIQNDYGLFQASVEVAARRRALRDDAKAEVVADKPGPPVLAVYADESSKTKHRYLVVASVWGLDIGRVWRVINDLDEWKRKAGVTGEFKFSELSKGKKLERAQSFVKKAVEHSALIGLKACVLDTEAASGLNGEERLYRLFYELVMAGVDHEIAAGRAVLPRQLHIVKDADAGPDALQLPDFERRLIVACREYFRDSVRLDSLVTGVSHESPLLQLADLFAGSVARKFNKEGETANAKDEFADFFETLAGFDFVKGGGGESDFVYVHRLGLTGGAAAPEPAAPRPFPLVELVGE